MRERKDEKIRLALPVYESHPPAWLPQIHAAADLGYAGFHPPRPGQDEDVLSEANVKNGFILGHSVSAETFSAQAMINENLHLPDTLSRLEQLMNEVFTRRAERIPHIPSSTFRMPTRVTLNDSKRQAWFADLANPDVPLHKLGKSVPHGAKGQDLLDLLYSNNIAIPRAVWFLRVFGANETAGLRNKPGYNPMQYSVDWANVVTGYMKKQLTEIALPSAPRPGLNIKQTFKGVLADADTRERWISRFTYCLKLLRTFYVEGLVDHKTFLGWLVQQMGSCNLAQAGFLTRLTEEYLDDIMESRALARPLVEACLCKLAEIRVTSAQEYLVCTEELLKILLQRLCLSIPDAFISPRMWSTHSGLLTTILNENVMDPSNNLSVKQNIYNIQQSLLSNFHDVKRRNEAMLFRDAPTKVSARLATAVSDVKLLNSISNDTDMHSVSFFAKEFEDTPTFKDKLDMLLSWSVTPLQYGEHRPFGAVTLIRIWRDKACERATRRDFSTPNEFLQDQLFDWLDSSDIAGEPSNIRAIALLYGKLVKHELFSYAAYIQRLIARGEPGLSYAEEVESRHRRFLKWIPLMNSTPSLINQRKVALYGARARGTPEDETDQKIRIDMHLVLPELFGEQMHLPLLSTAALLSQCTSLVSASRFEQVRAFRWLLPVLKKHIAKQGSGANLRNAYCVSVELMAYCQCFRSILDLTLCMLEHSMTSDSLTGVIDTLHRYATIWACMDVMPAIVAALDSAHQLWKMRGMQSRALLGLLMELDNQRYLSEASRERSLADLSTFALALQPVTDRPEPVPSVLPEILLLVGESQPDAPSLLANALWIKYRMSFDWAWKVWDNTVASLRQVPNVTSDIAGRRSCAVRYGAFLWHVDQHLPHGLDDDVLRWFIGPGKNEVSALSADAWDILTVVLLYLAVHGALKTTTILRGLVYPAWQLGASSSGAEHGGVPETYVRAANNLCHHLLLQENGNGDDLPPVDLFDVQCTRTRRHAVYCEPHFPLLVASVPLLISLESNDSISQELRDETRVLRHQLCRDPGFRQGAYRNLDVIREAFENSPHLMETTPESLSKSTIAGLRMILYDSAEEVELYDWPQVTCLLSPWKIVATAIQMQFMIKQLGRALLQESTQEAASANLDKLTVMLFHHTKTSEEACYVGEMARGADAAVAGKFINNGLNCITEILTAAPTTASDISAECLKRVGELLRVLIYVAQPFRDDPSLLPHLESIVQDGIVDALVSRITMMESTLTSNQSNSIPLPHVTEDLILLLRLLQFILGFRCTWTVRMKDISANLSDSLFRLALYYGTGNHLDLLAYPFFFDTLLYVYDEIPSDSKAITFDPFSHCPDISPDALPPDLPLEYRKQLICLLPNLPSNISVSNLMNSYRDSHGHLVYGSPVVNRPWEWIENLGEPSVLDPKEEARERDEKERLKMKYLVKNSGSLSLDSFGARLTGDGILRNASEGLDPRTEGNVRSFEDGLSAEGLFTRDWRETRVDLDSGLSSGSSPHVKGEANHEGNGLSVYTVLPKVERRSTPRASPASSVVSRSSARGSTAPMRQSPTHGLHNRPSNSTISDIIDVDSITTGSSSRKASSSKRKVAAISDDEIEILEGPTMVPSSKKPRVKAPPKGRTKKR